MFAPADDDGLGQRNIAPGIGRAIDAERHLVGGACADHAKPAVVIDVGRPQRDAGELTDEVRLLVRHRSAAQHGERVAAVLRSGFCRIASTVRFSASSHVASRKPSCVRIERRKQTVRMFVLQIALHALWAEHSAIHRKLFPGLEAHDLVVMNLQLNAALHAAEAAMRLHQRAVGLLRPSLLTARS